MGKDGDNLRDNCGQREGHQEPIEMMGRRGCRP